MVQATTSVTFPVTGKSVGANPTIYGGYYDKNSGVTQIQYLLVDQTAGNKWWDGINSQWQNTALPSQGSWPSASIWASSWTITLPAGQLPNAAQNIDSGNKFYLETSALDRAGNVESDFSVGVSSITLYLDTQTVVISNVSPGSPVGSQWVNSVTTLSGLYSDLPGSPLDTSVQSIEVRLSSGATTPSTWYSGFSHNWVGSSTWSFACNGTCSGGAWTYSIANSNFSNGAFYWITGRGTDSVGNLTTIPDETTSANSTFFYDVALPTSTITAPVSNGFYTSTSLTTISGTAVDSAPGALNNVQVAVQDLDTTEWWDGTSSWGNSGSIPTWFNTTAPYSAWTYTVPTTMFSARSNHQFAIRSRAIDKATNSEQNGNGTTPFNFVIDSTAPASALTSLANNAVVSTITAVSGTATDISAFGHTRMQSVYVNLYDTSSGLVYKPGHPLDTSLVTPGWFQPAAPYSLNYNAQEYFNLVTYANFPPVTASSGTWSWNVPNMSPFNGDILQFISEAQDQAGNFEKAWSTTTFSLDQYKASPQSPNSIVTSPINNFYTKTALTTISGTATALVSLTNVKVKFMRLIGSTTWYYESGAWTNTDSGTYPLATAVAGKSASWTYDVTGKFDVTDVPYMVTSIANDQAGNTQLVLSTNTFIYDTQYPTSTIVYPANNGFISQTGQVQGTTVDNFLTGSVLVRISTGSHTWFWTGSSWTTTSNTLRKARHSLRRQPHGS